MKTSKYVWICLFAVIGVILVLSGSCKKNDDNPVPVFSITADSVMLQGGGTGLQFFAKCTNNDVKMTEVKVTSPTPAQNMTYSLSGSTFNKNVEFSLQDDNTAYFKELGTWSFIFTGTLTSDNSSFSVDATLSVTE
jgi:hypothetical protein